MTFLLDRGPCNPAILRIIGRWVEAVPRFARPHMLPCLVRLPLKVDAWLGSRWNAVRSRFLHSARLLLPSLVVPFIATASPTTATGQAVRIAAPAFAGLVDAAAVTERPVCYDPQQWLDFLLLVRCAVGLR
jgi:hypothetical protein